MTVRPEDERMQKREVAYLEWAMAGREEQGSEEEEREAADAGKR